MNPIRLLNLGSIPAEQTQAVYHALAERMDDDAQDTIVLCRPNHPYLCLGCHQVFGSVFDIQECERRGLPVIRRQIGGGATYLDENQLFYQCIFHQSHMPAMVKDMYAFALAAPVLALRRLGLNAELRDTNEIEVDGKRIAGTGGGQIGEACVVVGNLLFDFDYEAMTAVWCTPSTAFRSLAQKALLDRMVTLNDLTTGLTMEKVTDLLIESFSSSTGRLLISGDLSDDEKKAVQEKAEELASPEYLSLHKTALSPEPMHTLKISVRALIRYDSVQKEGYAVHGNFWLSEDTIREVILESIPARQWHNDEDRLRGAPFLGWKERLELAENSIYKEKNQAWK
jgi:lipoate---protein ligase